MSYLNRWDDGSETGLPSGKVVCVGRNYAEHAKELNNPVPTSPILFIKPKTALVSFDSPIIIPTSHGPCHHEAEIAVLISKPAKNISEHNAQDYIAGYGIGLDLTLRELQTQLKEKGHPWEVAKSFDGACPMTGFVKASQITSPQTLGVMLRVNGTVRQKGDMTQMLFSVKQLIASMSCYFTLEAGDIVMTGTPAGVSAMTAGDQLEVSLFDEERLALKVDSVVGV